MRKNSFEVYERAGYGLYTSKAQENKVQPLAFPDTWDDAPELTAQVLNKSKGKPSPTQENSRVRPLALPWIDCCD
jgi:hypothetical protein